VVLLEGRGLLLCMERGDPVSWHNLAKNPPPTVEGFSAPCHLPGERLPAAQASVEHFDGPGQLQQPCHGVVPRGDVAEPAVAPLLCPQEHA
jgi:hypothetical protein